MSDNVRSAISKLGVVENMGIAVKISFIVGIHEQVSCIDADFKVYLFPAAILDFLNVSTMV